MKPALRPLLAALACAMATAHADSNWICPAPGNALNPAGVNPVSAGRWMDEEGMGTRIPTAHSPSGQAYNIPYDNPDETPDKKDASWKQGGFAEVGGLKVFGNQNAAGFLQYKDLKSGGYLDNFAAWGEKASEARFYEATGGAVGMDDQFYRLQFGRYNDWKVTAYYDGTPQVFTTTYRSLWSGLGGSELALTGLKPGGTTSAAATQTNIQRALAATPTSELEAVRKKAGLRYDANLSETWKFYAAATDQKREGSQPFGAVFGGGGGGGNIEIPQSIDTSTYDVVAGLRYGDPTSSFNLRASASFFRNDIDTLTFQNPLYITTNGSNGLSPTLFTQGRFDMAPDNEAFNLKAEYARHFPDFYRGYFTSTVALGTMRQNDALIAPTQYPLTGGTVTPGNVPLAGNWNTTSALSRQSAETRIDTVLGDFGLLLRPANTLDVRGKVRYYETRNESTPYFACNPLTGQWGRLLNDGSGLSLAGASTATGANPAGTSPNAYNAAMCNLAAARALNVAPAAGNVPLGSVPYAYRQLVANVGADYRIGKSSSVSGVVERETFHRDFRERDETREDKVKLSWVDRGTLDGTIRVSYEFDDRGGGAYNTNPYLPYYSASLGPVPAANGVNLASWFKTMDQFRSFDLADRRQNILNGRVDYMVSQNMDGAFTLQMKDAAYPSDLGRTGHQRTNSATLDLSYRAGEKAVIFGYYSYQSGVMDQKGVQPNGCTAGYTYYFYSDGRIANGAIGAAPPPPPAGTTLIATQNVLASNFTDVCGNASATSPLFPDSRGWNVQSKDRNDLLGLGVKYDLGKVKLEGDFTRSLARTRIGYSYNPAALGMSATQAALAGGGLSDITFSQNIFNASALFPVSPNVLVRLVARYESGRIRDWHYDGVAANPMPTNNTVYLDGGPQDYHATVVGILLHIRM